MRMRRNEYKRMKHAIWKSRGDWQPTYAYDQQHAEGIEFQHYALDASGKLVYAGVTRHAHANQAIANQVHRVWRRWRNEYDNVFSGVGRDYPAKHAQSVVTLVMFPIDSPQQQVHFAV